MFQDSVNTWKAFSASYWLWKVFSLQKVFKKLKKVVVGWWKVRWIWPMRQNFIAQFIQRLKCRLCGMWSGIAVENWALSVDQCWLQALQFLVYLTGLLSILPRCNGFVRIQKVSQTDNRPPDNSDHDHFFGASLASESALKLPLGLATELVISCCLVKSTFCCTLQSNTEMVHCCYIEKEMMIFQNDNF